ncbi:hypothetical protein [uncultured Sphingomonas sp.]|uniref:hypothetical protein n=1 Tax=uncultured Sphingomonas sp. TaxID=158754 RepID=UPI0035CAC6D0
MNGGSVKRAGVAAGLALAAWAAGPVRAQDVRVAVRDVADGPGPSHLLAMGDWLLVVDPWSYTIRRYAVGDLAVPPRTCVYPRAFAPWRSLRRGGEIRIVAEPYGPDVRGYRLRPRSTMTLTPALVDAMPLAGPCRFPIRTWRATADTLPTGHADPRRPGALILALASGARASIVPHGGPGAQVYAARTVGALSGDRTLLWWSEIDPAPDAATIAAGVSHAGRVTARQHLGVFGAGGGAAQRVIALTAAAYPALRPDAPNPPPAILAKPGFEIAAATTRAGRDTLWLLAADRGARAQRAFVIRGIALDGTEQAVQLVAPAGTAIDRIDAEMAGRAPSVAVAPASHDRALWFARARAELDAQIAVRWRYPAAAIARPCGGADRCAIAADAIGALGTGPVFATPVTDRLARAGGAHWVRPRTLVGLAAGETVRGVPYSIGGDDLADAFAARLATEYGPGATATPTPIGHIGEGMEWPEAAGHYPLGIDCSALVARVFGLGMRATAAMVRTAPLPGPDGRRWALPLGPARSCPQPVRHVADLRAGDVLVRDGHVVIFSRDARIGGAPGWQVFESGSRCSGVCESVYDPSYFDGWWIVRLKLAAGDDRDCPRWLPAATPAAAP